jgi:hypothetical protein
MHDPLDVSIDDPELGEEIQLLSDLMVLAARAERVDTAAVDAVLFESEVPRQRGPGGTWTR